MASTTTPCRKIRRTISNLKSKSVTKCYKIWNKIKIWKKIKIKNLWKLNLFEIHLILTSSCHFTCRFSNVDPRAPADARSNNPLTAVVHYTTTVCVIREKFIRFSLYIYLNAIAFIFSLKFSHSKLLTFFCSSFCCIYFYVREAFRFSI